MCDNPDFIIGHVSEHVFYVPSTSMFYATAELTHNNVLMFVYIYVVGIWADNAGEVDHRTRHLHTFTEEDPSRFAAQH
jgi:hypothetical protein